MSRKLQTLFPAISTTLAPKHPNTAKLNIKEENQRINMKVIYYHYHAAKPLVSLNKGEEVFIKDSKENGMIEESNHECSCTVKTP